MPIDPKVGIALSNVILLIPGSLCNPQVRLVTIPISLGGSASRPPDTSPASGLRKQFEKVFSTNRSSLQGNTHPDAMLLKQISSCRKNKPGRATLTRTQCVYSYMYPYVCILYLYWWKMSKHVETPSGQRWWRWQAQSVTYARPSPREASIWWRWQAQSVTYARPSPREASIYRLKRQEDVRQVTKQLGSKVLGNLANLQLIRLAL